MAARNPRSRKAPRKKRDSYLVRGRQIRIAYFDGFRLRHGQPDDVDIMHWRGDGSRFSDVLARDTLYIDAPYVHETPYFVAVYELQTMRKWTTRGDDKKRPPYQKLREYLKQKLCPSGPVPEAEYVVRRDWDEEHQLNVWYVRGDVVRRRFDPHFTHGGHDLVYPSYITVPRTIWIDVTDEREMPFSLLHEIVERGKMEKGWSYNDAHACAIRSELAVRVREYFVTPRKTTDEPLPVEPIGQVGDAACGPASGLMLCAEAGIVNPETGKPFTEAEFAALCGCDPDLGTDHAPLVRAFEKLVGKEGFVHGEAGDLKLLRRIVGEERRPVLVGWWNGPHRTAEEVQADPDLDEGHFAVVIGIDQKKVTLADPWILNVKDDSKSGPGRNVKSIRSFHSRWYDMDGSPTETDPGYRLVRGWYLYLRAPPPKSD